MDFAKLSNYTIEIYFVQFYFGQQLYFMHYLIKLKKNITFILKM
jgi:hypothetical protein